jgi:hypothetical protein
MSGIKVKGEPNWSKAAAKVEMAVTDAGEDVAQEAYDQVRKRLAQVLQHPTGAYESRVMVSNQSNTMMITDGGVVYGPWLEGVSSRNNSSRFKGYHTFRQVLQQVDKHAEQIADLSIGQAVKTL